MTKPLLALALLSIAAAPAIKPGEKVWNITGAHGTAGQIREQLHQEIDEFNRLIPEAKSELAGRDDELARHHKYLLGELRKTNSQYEYVCKTLEAAQEELKQAKGPVNIARTQNKIDGFEKRRAAIEEKEMPQDAEEKNILERRAEKEDRLKKLESSLQKAIAYRREIAQSVRGSFKLTWPLARDDAGIIGQATITRITSTTITATGHVFMPMKQDAGNQEGIVTVRGLKVPTTFVVGDYPSDSLAVGQEVRLDRIVKVLIASMVGEEAMVVCRRFKAPEDDLLDAVREWDDP